MTTIESKNQTPAYVNTCERIAKFVEARGIELVPQSQTVHGWQGNAGWACFQISGTEHKVYVQRSMRDQPVLHTTIDVPEDTAGKLPHTDRNGKDKREGKITAFFSSDPSTLENLLELWAGTSTRIRAAKLPARRQA